MTRELNLFSTGLGCRTCFWLPCLLLLTLAGGCAPKKVIRQADGRLVAVQEQTTNSPQQTDQETDADGSRNPFLPEPGPRGRSGVPQVRSTPDRLIMGVKAAELAQQQLGKPYQWGAAGPNKFDCSGLVQYVYGALGVDLPRVSYRQASVGARVPRSELQPGDLLFFATRGNNVNHVGIYLGHDEFVHAPRRYVPVRTDSLNNAWWRQRYQGARRVK